MSNSVCFFLLALCFIALAVLGTQYNECSEQGGQFVRGLLWYTCIGETP